MDENSSPEPSPATRKRKQRTSRLLFVFVAMALGVPTGFLFANLIRIPLVETLDTYRPSVITHLYTKDGESFAEYAIQRRIMVRKKEMSPWLVNSIIATEDANFYGHGGLDPKAILRAGIKDIIARKKIEGASTLTQQLAKQVFLTPEKSWRRKINEAFLAIEIEKNFTKDQIFEMYANQVYLGHVAYGVEAASRFYFGKHASDLSLAESALLAGLIRRPMAYSPITNRDAAVRRRNHVLRRLLDEKYIGGHEFEQARSAPIVLGSYQDEAPQVGAYFAEEVRQYIEQHYGTEDLYRNGLEVWTTLDLKIQTMAESALRRGLERFDRRRGFRKPTRNVLAEGVEPESYRDPNWHRPLAAGHLYSAAVLTVERNAIEVQVGGETARLERNAYAWTRRPSMTDALTRGDIVHVRYELDPKEPQSRIWHLDQLPQVQGAVVVLDVKSGEIRGLAGGYDFRTSKFNRAVQSLRQTGSAFKPFVYGAAFEKGFTPADTLFDAPVTIPVGNQNYSPRNYGGEYSGIVTIQRAVELSINVPAVKTYMMVGGENVIDFARRSGVTASLPQYPSLALGAGGISPLEMTAAYNVFANQGVHIKPRSIRKITDATAKVLEETYPELSEATTAQVAYVLSYVMQGTIDRGTAYAAHTLPGGFAGKTGTTNGFTDAWFIGFSPEYTVGVWVGYDDPSRSLGARATGADVALPIWIDIFKQMDEAKLRGEPKDFEQPPGIVIVPMDLKTGRRGVGPCGRIVQEAFVAGQEPDRDCSGATVAVSRLPFYLQRPFYQPKETEPTDEAVDPAARPGEGAESPVPALDESTPVSEPPQ
ncbi:MAG TPA: PBP1A family penicillin-binding protein [Thermoanaerobaculia bacterium]|nr:PBP1A family penicillin-binding protein [Thermoanaerobaculia bacterium]